MRLLLSLGIFILNVAALAAERSSTGDGLHHSASSKTSRSRLSHVERISNEETVFSGKLVEEVFKKHRANSVISPLSTTLSLSMASLGAKSITDFVIRKVLGLGRSHVPRKAAFKRIVKQLNNQTAGQLYFDNSIFLSSKIRGDSEFMETNLRTFGSRVQKVDFELPEASNFINAWCEHKTHGHVTDVVSAADFDENTGLVLTSASYFKPTWLHKFDVEETQPRAFFLEDGREIQVPSMVGKQILRHGEYPEVNATFVELGLLGNGGRNMSLFVFLPRERNGVAYFEENFHKINLKNLSHLGKHKEVNLQIPKVNIRSHFDLRGPLINMGMANLFDWERADFSGILASDEPPFEGRFYSLNSVAGSRGLFINKIVQETSIEIDEGDFQAAPAIVADVADSPETKPEAVPFIVDRSFYGLVTYLPDKNPLNVFTFRYTGIEESTTLQDAIPRFF